MFAKVIRVSRTKVLAGATGFTFLMVCLGLAIYVAGNSSSGSKVLAAGPRDVDTSVCAHRAPNDGIVDSHQRVHYQHSPESVVVCRFSVLLSPSAGSSGQLTLQRTLSARQSALLISELDAAKIKPSSQGVRNCPADDGTRFRIRLVYESQKTKVVDVTPTGCRVIRPVVPDGAPLVLGPRLEKQLKKWTAS